MRCRPRRKPGCPAMNRVAPAFWNGRVRICEESPTVNTYVLHASIQGWIRMSFTLQYKDGYVCPPRFNTRMDTYVLHASIQGWTHRLDSFSNICATCTGDSSGCSTYVPLSRDQNLRKSNDPRRLLLPALVKCSSSCSDRTLASEKRASTRRMV